MKSQNDIFYEALVTRDHRFDGKFFTGVKTTGIYCRPICPARPKRENVEFFLSAAAAEKNGYRPCLRCRPESAPASAVWIGKTAVVRRALKVMTHQGLNELNEDEFADRFGVSARHLRRLFEEELGKTPKKIFDHQRLDFARKLVIETSLPITEIALSSGFNSIRRFNDAFQKRFSRSPVQLRKSKSKSGETSGVELTLSYRPPFAWSPLLNFFHSHQMGGVDSVNDEKYERVFVIEKSVGAFSLSHDAKKQNIRVKIVLDDYSHLFLVIQKIRQMFDLDADPILIANTFSDSKVMTRLYEETPGLRLPRAWDVYESVIATVLGQLVSVVQGKKLLKDLIFAYGKKVKNPFNGKEAYLFPTPKVLAIATLKEVGTTQKRKEAIREISRLVSEKKLNLDPTQDSLALKKALLEVKGIGEWTAEYIRLRALGDPDAFPATDLVLARALEQYPDLVLDQFQPWRGYAAVYLWDHLMKQKKSQEKKK